MFSLKIFSFSSLREIILAGSVKWLSGVSFSSLYHFTIQKHLQREVFKILHNQYKISSQKYVMSIQTIALLIPFKFSATVFRQIYIIYVCMRLYIDESDLKFVLCAYLLNVIILQLEWMNKSTVLLF